ncbi:hypothetical protein H1R20_g4691, partial [Candolleomyces eurysporus]
MTIDNRPKIVSPHDVKTTLNYCVPHGPIPLIKYITEPPEGTPWMNFDIVPYPVTIHDVRSTPLETGASLDTQAFQFLEAPCKEREFLDEAEFAREGGYYDEVKELVVKNVDGAKKVVVFDHTLRRLAEEPKGDRGVERGPLLRVHVDQTEDSALRRVHKHLPEDEANRLLSLPNQRVRIVNVWRPIENVVAHNPLAVADWRSVKHARDLVVTRKMLQPGKGEGGTYNVRHNEEHKWYYMRDMTPNEVVLLKCSDTQGVDEGGIAKMCLHTAFKDETSDPEAPSRQSIEVSGRSVPFV